MFDSPQKLSCESDWNTNEWGLSTNLGPAVQPRRGDGVLMSYCNANIATGPSAGLPSTTELQIHKAWLGMGETPPSPVVRCTNRWHAPVNILVVRSRLLLQLLLNVAVPAGPKPVPTRLKLLVVDLLGGRGRTRPLLSQLLQLHHAVLDVGDPPLGKSS